MSSPSPSTCPMLSRVKPCSPQHPLVTLPRWSHQDELGPHRGSAALGSSGKELKEAMGMEGTLPQNGPWRGSALGDPCGTLPSHPRAGDSVEAVEQSRPLRLPPL